MALAESGSASPNASERVTCQDLFVGYMWGGGIVDILSRRAAQHLLRENVCLDFVNPVVLDADADFFFLAPMSAWWTGALQCSVVVGGSAEAHLSALTDAMTAAGAHRRLAEKHHQVVWEWPWDGDLARMVWPVIPATVELLMSADLRNLKVCPGCGWLFLDSSKNHSRRWCRMSDCGNLAKVRTHRSRSRPSKQ